MNTAKFDYENTYLAQSLIICGIDEVGRGPLAGPVVACAIIPNFSKILSDVDDSKKLTDKKRRTLFSELKSCTHSIQFINETVIDEINILNATKLAMTQAVANLEIAPDVVLCDALRLDLPMECISIIHGDTLSYSIAAASILAKVARDDLMIEYARQYPEYGFDLHKGYGTTTHIAALKKYGPCPIHRKSFIKNFV
ncbi:MAG: ribonuclease HII [Christensenellaceae bacterium]|jgi:ribonuclease HII|nr:ribonuclease HII [Christensenellaceae bacterium]